MGLGNRWTVVKKDSSNSPGPNSYSNIDLTSIGSKQLKLKEKTQYPVGVTFGTSND